VCQVENQINLLLFAFVEDGIQDERQAHQRKVANHHATHKLVR
jgi:hypothetical protein